MSDLHGAIGAFLAASPYYACLLLVNPDTYRLANLAGDIVSAYGWPRLLIGRELSRVLLPEPPRNRPPVAQQWAKNSLRDLAPGPVLCADIDFLFEPALALDPLALLRQASRVTRLVVTWPGNYVNDVLTYAVPEHRHYRAWRQAEVSVLATD